MSDTSGPRGSSEDGARPTGARFIKVSRRPSDDRRIQRESALLAGLRHPGVVRLITADTAGYPNVLITERVDGPSLADAGPLGTQEIARIVDAVAAILADLHARGVVHGAIAPEHILLRPDGQPVLCGLGYGGRIGGSAAPLPPGLAAYAHPRRADAPLAPEFDLHALGEVRRSLMAAAGGGPVAGMPELAGRPGRRPNALAVGALVGTALVLGAGFWGLTRRPGPDTPGALGGVTTTSPASTAGGDGLGRASPGPVVDRGPGSGATPPAPPSPTPRTTDGEGSDDGVDRPAGARPSPELRSSAVGAGPGSGGAQAAQVVLAEDGAPCPPERPAGSAPAAVVSAVAFPPAPRSTGSASTRRDVSTAAPATSSAPTTLPPASPPGGADVNQPPLLMPPPDSLPPGVVLPDAATLWPQGPLPPVP